MKVCTKCKIEKSYSEFYKYKRSADGFQCYCISCKKIKLKEYRNKKLNKKVKIKEKSCSDCLNLKNIKEFNFNPLSRDMFEKRCKSCQAVKDKKYREKNRDKLTKQKNDWSKQKSKENLLYRLSLNYRSRLKSFLISNKRKKTEKSMKMLGGTLEDLKLHLEKQFKDGMTWDNYGYNGWHIDHITPLSWAKSEEELYKLCHYLNLQPLWAKDNMKKGNRYV